MAIKICPKCGGKVSTSRDECIHCGYVFPKTKQCPDCGESCPPEAKECPGCGYLFEGADKAASGASAPLKGDGQNGFRVSGGVLLSYSGNEAEVRIPDGVVSVGSAAFRGNLAVRKVVFPDSVTSIGDEAFCGCANLKELGNYSSVASFGRSAFEGAGLAEVEVGPAVAFVGECCFSGMTGLERLVYKPNKVLRLKSAFSDCPKLSDVEMDQEYFFFSKWESGRAVRPKGDDRPTIGDAFRRTAFMERFDSDVNGCVCPKCGGKLTPTPAGRKCDSCGIYFEKDHYWSHREDKKPDEETVGVPSSVASNEDATVPNGETVSNEDGSPSCPYCHGEELMEIGRGYYLCLTCKMRFLDAQGASAGFYTSPDYVAQGEAKENDSTQREVEESSFVPETGPSLETEQEGGSSKNKDPKKRRKRIIIWSSVGTICALVAAFAVLIPCVFIPYGELVQETNSYWNWRSEERRREEENKPNVDRYMEGWDESDREKFGAVPVVNASEGTLTYGIYPQTVVSDSSLIQKLDALPEKNGIYYLDGGFYSKTEAHSYFSSCYFDDGAEIVSGMTYWFKCEPITWRILSTKNGEYSLVSTLLLDAHRYNEYWDGKDSNGYCANNYERSEIREWLNIHFYSWAFCLDDSKILTTKVDNSASTTGSNSNRYACSNTTDKVYLLNRRDYENADYFADSEARQCKTTDWARAKGAYCTSSSSSELYNGWYWTRSPHSGGSGFAWGVRSVGSLGYYRGVGGSDCSVRPSLRIKVAQ